MYERSAIVLERYLSKIFGQDNATGIKANYYLYTDILEEMEKYQMVTEEEEKVIEEFDAIAQKMQTIQKKQEMLCSDSIEQEEERNRLFNDFDQDPAAIEKKILKVEKILEENEEQQKQLREEYIELFSEFIEKQRTRNRCSKTRRTAETNHMKVLNETAEKMELIDPEVMGKVKQFSAINNEEICQKLNKIMLENGKNEKIKFDSEVIKKAVATRIEIAKKEAECYLNSYDKLKKLMTEIEGDSIKLAKYQKAQRDIQMKLEFLDSEKEYIVSFLDNERMTAVGGEKNHKQMMKDACEKYDVDIMQINNLYDLLIKEMAGKATKKAYNELYNSTYLTNIEETEKSFNQEVNSIKSSVGTIINTNYWRIEGIKNIYEIFNRQVQENFERDLTEFMPIEEAKELKKSFKNEKSIDDDEDEWFISNDEIGNMQSEKDPEESEQEEDDEDWFGNLKDYEDYNEENDEDENDLDDYDEKNDKDKFEEENEENEFALEEDNDTIFGDDEEDDDEYEDEEAEEDEQKIKRVNMQGTRDNNDFEAKLREKLANKNKGKNKKYEEFAWDEESKEEKITRTNTGKNKKRKAERMVAEDDKGIFNKFFKK